MSKSDSPQSQGGTGDVGGRAKGSRSDPPGMRRTSLYVTEDAAEAFEGAADRVLAALDEDVPRHVALSALLLAGAERAEDVARGLARKRAEELTARLAALQQTIK
jgi:hypothetical protein